MFLGWNLDIWNVHFAADMAFVTTKGPFGIVSRNPFAGRAQGTVTEETVAWTVWSVGLRCAGTGLPSIHNVSTVRPVGQFFDIIPRDDQ